jgi:general secretion pathway protein B
MSYILDALQRADAERARGSVPTLNARPLASPTASPSLTAAQRAGLAIAGLVLLLLAAAWAWSIWGSATPQPGVVVSPLPAVPGVTQAVASAVAPTFSAQPAQAAAVVQVAPPPVRPPTVPAPTPATLPKSPSTEKATVAQPALANPSSTVAAPKAAAPAPVAALAPLLSELPEATRRDIPPLAISGAVYSENPAQRLLLVNGQVLNQGSEVAPDLKVVEIRSNVSEFSFRGTRFRLAH